MRVDSPLAMTMELQIEPAYPDLGSWIGKSFNVTGRSLLISDWIRYFTVTVTPSPASLKAGDGCVPKWHLQPKTSPTSPLSCSIIKGSSFDTVLHAGNGLPHASSTIVKVSVPAPLTLAPILLSKSAWVNIPGSRAAFSITVTPSARPSCIFASPLLMGIPYRYVLPLRLRFNIMAVCSAPMASDARDGGSGGRPIVQPQAWKLWHGHCVPKTGPKTTIREPTSCSHIYKEPPRPLSCASITVYFSSLIKSHWLHSKLQHCSIVKTSDNTGTFFKRDLSRPRLLGLLQQERKNSFIFAPPFLTVPTSRYDHH